MLPELADVTPGHNKRSETFKDNYGPINILFNLPKFIKGAFIVKLTFI